MLLVFKEPQIKYQSTQERLSYLRAIREDKEKKEETIWSKIFKAVSSFFIDVVLEVAIDALSVVLPIGAIPLQLIKIGARFVKNVIVSLVENNGAVDWASVAISTAIETATFGLAKGLSYIKKVTKFGKGIAKGIQATKKAVSFIKQGLTQKIETITKTAFKYVDKYKLIKSNTIRKFVNAKTISKAIQTGKEFFSIVKNPFSLVTKLSTKAQQLVKKNIKDKMVRLQAAYYKKQLQNQIIKKKVISPKTANKYIRANRLANKGQFYFNSSWISGIRLYDERYWDQSNDVSFFLYFKRDATKSKNSPKGKRPLQFTMSYEEMFNFLKAPSKGQYYLDNWAWGWDMGRIRIDTSTEFEVDKLVQRDFLKRFRLAEHYATADALDETLFQTNQYDKYVKKHRTNKTQLFAYQTTNAKGKKVLKFTPYIYGNESRTFTKQAKRIKRTK
ncbi:hypothetical protein [Mycoplasma sp. 4079]|uniref:hypothetical protein n=1 Tax=Mycoplasma sp. 4079 TaxID=3398615 RepID=UPI0039FC34FC